MESTGSSVKKAPSKMSASVLKKELNNLSKNELIALLLNCYKSSKEVQQYLSVEFIGQESIEELYKKYKLQIQNEFFPERGYGKLRLSKAKKAISCRNMGVSAALERSRSGNGGHVWIFFDRPLPASLARKLGCSILTRTMEGRPQIGLDSYDRFFPNQDTMPKGGFGNLIALPLQHFPRKSGNSLFLNQDLQPYQDQWMFLSEIKKMQTEEVESIVRETTRAGSIIGVQKSLTDIGSSHTAYGSVEGAVGGFSGVTPEINWAGRRRQR